VLFGSAKRKLSLFLAGERRIARGNFACHTTVVVVQ